MSDDEFVRQHGVEMAALKQLAYGLAGGDVEEYDSLIEGVHSTIDRVNNLEAENERLRERVSELEARENPHPESKEYKQLSRDEKVQILRESLVEKAAARHNGRFAMSYNDVMWLFDGHPSAGHCYQLMELAGEAEGFSYAIRNGQSNQIRVNVDGVNDETLFHAVNKAPEEVRL